MCTPHKLRLGRKTNWAPNRSRSVFRGQSTPGLQGRGKVEGSGQVPGAGDSVLGFFAFMHFHQQFAISCMGQANAERDQHL